MINEKELRAAAVELNEVLTLDPPLNEKEKNIKTLTKEVTDVLGLIDPEKDSFSDTTKAIIVELNPDIFPEVEEVEAPKSLLEEVDVSDDLTELKNIAKANDEFKSIRGRLSSFKKAEDLKDEMLGLINFYLSLEAGPEEEAAAEAAHQRNIAKAPIRTSRDAGKAAPAAKTAKPAGKGVPANFKREGSFAEFLDNRVKEGGLWDEILTDAKQDAEGRGKTTSLGAIKAHVKFRVGKDAKFLGKLKMTNDGIQ